MDDQSTCATTADPSTALLLEMRDGARLPVPESAELAAALRLIAADGKARATLLGARGGSVEALLPRRPVPPSEPDWLRAEALLDEETACPGERLFAGAMEQAAAWWPAAEVRAALEVFAAAIAGNPRAFAGLDANGIDAGCRALAAQLDTLEEGHRIGLVISPA